MASSAWRTLFGGAAVAAVLANLSGQTAIADAFYQAIFDAGKRRGR